MCDWIKPTTFVESRLLPVNKNKKKRKLFEVKINKKKHLINKETIKLFSFNKNKEKINNKKNYVLALVIITKIMLIAFYCKT